MSSRFRLVSCLFIGELVETDRRHDRVVAAAPQTARSSGRCPAKAVLFALLAPVRTPGFRTFVMAVETSFFHNFRFPRRGSHYLIAATLALAVACGGAVYAANNSVQGAKKDDHAFDGDAPTAILIEGSSG